MDIFISRGQETLSAQRHQLGKGNKKRKKKKEKIELRPSPAKRPD
jgi:hypothetical protein